MNKGAKKRADNVAGNIKAILFDFDGTLTRPGGIDFPAIKRTVHCPPDMPLLEYIAGLPTARARAQASRVLERYEEAAARRSRPHAGAEALVRFLQSRGFRLGILTRNSRRSLQIAFRNFRRLQMSDFTVVITRDNVCNPKPHPDGVLSAVRRLKATLDQLVVVGDYRYDIEAGRRAGARTVFLDNGAAAHRPDPPADFTIKRLTELRRIIYGHQS